MSGSEMQRYCDHCHLHVHDLSTLTQDEGAKTDLQPGRPSLRPLRASPRWQGHDRRSNPTLSYRTAPGKAGYRWRLWSVISLVAAGAAGYTGWFRKASAPPAPAGMQMTMGDICPVSPAPQQRPPTNRSSDRKLHCGYIAITASAQALLLRTFSSQTGSKHETRACHRRILSLILLTAAFAEDWPQWRGANRDGKVAGFTPLPPGLSNWLKNGRSP